MTDKEALDQIAASINTEPMDAFSERSWVWIRTLLRATGRTVKDNPPPSKNDDEPVSGYG